MGVQHLGGSGAEAESGFQRATAASMIMEQRKTTVSNVDHQNRVT